MAMRLNSLKPAPGAKRPRLRVRKGGYHKVGFEGGQMPIQRRMPKVGFRSAMKATRAEVRLDELAKVECDLVDLAALLKAQVVQSGTESAKLTLSGKIEA